MEFKRVFLYLQFALLLWPTLLVTGEEIWSFLELNSNGQLNPKDGVLANTSFNTSINLIKLLPGLNDTISIKSLETILITFPSLDHGTCPEGEEWLRNMDEEINMKNLLKLIIFNCDLDQFPCKGDNLPCLNYIWRTFFRPLPQCLTPSWSTITVTWHPKVLQPSFCTYHSSGQTSTSSTQIVTNENKIHLKTSAGNYNDWSLSVMWHFITVISQENQESNGASPEFVTRTEQVVGFAIPNEFHATRAQNQKSCKFEVSIGTGRDRILSDGFAAARDSNKLISSYDRVHDNIARVIYLTGLYFKYQNLIILFFLLYMLLYVGIVFWEVVLSHRRL